MDWSVSYNLHAHGGVVEKACYKLRSGRRQQFLLDTDKLCITLHVGRMYVPKSKDALNS